MSKLPDWFTGTVYDEGDEVTNPFSGKTITLTANELSMLDLIKGAEMCIAMAIPSNGKELSDIIIKGTKWFKETNPEAYKILLDPNSVFTPVAIMFGLFKRKSEKEKLIELYNKKKEQAFRLSRTNRKEGDRLEKEANDILNKIDKIK